MGNANAVQAEEDVNTGSVQEAIASEANRAQLSQENEEIMKQLDLDSMYKKLSPAAKKPAAKVEKKPVNKVNLQQQAKTGSSKKIIKLQKADELLQAKAAPLKSKVVHTVKPSEELHKEKQCPKCKEMPQIVSLAEQANSLSFLTADDQNEEEIKLSIVPSDMRDTVTNEVQVLNSERIIGYDTFSQVQNQRADKIDAAMERADSDYYNVTVNFIMMRKGNKLGQKEKPKKVEDLDLGSTAEETAADTPQEKKPAPAKFDVTQYLQKHKKPENQVVENAIQSAEQNQEQLADQ